ncbi:hypothetical protein C1H76_0799 [Elsinoe australis]|uniref:Uncharacterized protein n=1 Tax=Elsinoe australis TaxID=40998 RepID=A0A4U7BEJ9_9PEZI|nr:hypothetical protein C1H76_0799 [Elsinoe australis]
MSTSTSDKPPAPREETCFISLSVTYTTADIAAEAGPVCLSLLNSDYKIELETLCENVHSIELAAEGCRPDAMEAEVQRCANEAVKGRQGAPEVKVLDYEHVLVCAEPVDQVAR